MESSLHFKKSYGFGKIAESLIASYFRNKGYAVLPIYEKEISDGKGPAIYFPDAEVIGTDMLIFKGKRIYWIEAKHKNAFSWHRLTERWVTGIDIKHYRHYQDIAKRTNYPVWLIFYHEGGQARDSPPDSPSGLFGNNLQFLIENENHRHQNWGRYGMVYWAVEKLILIETKDEFKSRGESHFEQKALADELRQLLS